jgi:hypothetical protein
MREQGADIAVGSSSAAKFGTLGITFRARKPVPGEEEEPTQCALA